MAAYIVYNDVFWVIMMIKNVINMLFMKERKTDVFYDGNYPGKKRF